MLTRHRPTVSVIIKALNEEQYIGLAIESALAALHGIDGEVILADSGSSDRTVEIAQRYPITIVQLTNRAERSCGLGAQLGFQYSNGRYLLLMDGDMRLQDGFLQPAIDVLDNQPAVAGVGGDVAECEIQNREFEQRDKRYDPDRNPGKVSRLNGSGLYRRSAIETIGYVTDRNLHGAEELDLAARLHARGWTLVRIAHPAIGHHGHTENAYRLLLRRISTRNSCAIGELLRGALGRPHFWFVVTKDHNCLLLLLVAGWWMTLALTPFVLDGWLALSTMLAIFLFPFVVMSLRWGSVGLALYSVSAWQVYALSFVPGFLRKRVSPAAWIESTVLQTSPLGDSRSANGAQLAGVPDARSRDDDVVEPAPQ